MFNFLLEDIIKHISHRSRTHVWGFYFLLVVGIFALGLGVGLTTLYIQRMGARYALVIVKIDSS